jgi:tetratricopeptide (TPR) repeat protein
MKKNKIPVHGTIALQNEKESTTFRCNIPTLKTKPLFQKEAIAFERRAEALRHIDFHNDEERATFVRRLHRLVLQAPPRWHDFTADLLAEPDELYGDNGLHSEVARLGRLVLEYPKSVTAQRMLEAAVANAQGLDALSYGDAPKAISLLAHAYRKYPYVVGWNTSIASIGRIAVKSIYTNSGCQSKHRAEALFVDAHLILFQGSQSNSDGNPRYTLFYQKVAMKQIMLAQLLLPDDPDLFALEGQLLYRLGSVSCIPAMNKAARLGCNDKLVLYTQAMACTSSLDDADQAISLLKTFVRVAEPDQWLLPEAYYDLSLLLGLKGPRFIGEAKRYFDRGDQAEAARLPVHKENDGCEPRALAHTLLKNYNQCGNPSCRSAALDVCSRCEKVYYCSVECQLSRWPFHKVWCKKHRAKGNGQD